MNRLRIFMKIYIFENIINKIKPRYKIVLPDKYYGKHYTLNSLHVFHAMYILYNFAQFIKIRSLITNLSKNIIGRLLLSILYCF